MCEYRFPVGSHRFFIVPEMNIDGETIWGTFLRWWLDQAERQTLSGLIGQLHLCMYYVNHVYINFISFEFIFLVSSLHCIDC